MLVPGAICLGRLLVTNALNPGACTIKQDLGLAG